MNDLCMFALISPFGIDALNRLGFASSDDAEAFAVVFDSLDFNLKSVQDVFNLTLADVTKLIAFVKRYMRT